MRSASLLVAFLSLAACENEGAPKPIAPKSRAAAVEGVAAPKPTESVATKPAAPVVRRKLCDGQMEAPGKDLPKSDLSRAGDPEPPKRIRTGGGQWTWVNFWAAWCVPCKEEIPRLRSWEKKLEKSEAPLRLVFVSLDDDERQLQKFLATQPIDGIKSTYWLKDGDERKDWLTEAELVDPELPAHLLVDPKGKVRCRVQGAVEDGDYERIVELLEG